VSPQTPRMPHDLGAERVVLFAVIADPAQTDELIEILPSAEDFYSARHGELWRAVRTLRSRNRDVDLVTLRGELDETGRLQAAGGDEELLAITEALPALHAVRKHAEHVRELARMRRLIEQAQRLAAIGMRGGCTLEELCDLAELTLGSAVAEMLPREPVSFREVVSAEFAKIQRQAAEPPRLQGWSYGLRKLDEITEGAHRGELVLIAGRPGSGKSALAEGVVTAIAAARVGGFVSSLEMNAGQWARRALAGESGVPASRLRSAQLEPRDWPKLTRAAERLWTLPVWIDDSPKLTARRLRSIVVRLKRKQPELGLVVVDYLGLMEHVQLDRHDLQVADTSRALKQLAREENVCVVALVQLNRDPEKRPNKRPNLGDLRDSGALEQDADTVLAVYRDVMYNPTTDTPDDAEILVLKQREGATGIVRCKFDAKITRFDDFEADVPEVQVSLPIGAE